MNILEINRFSVLFQQPLYIILFFFSSSSSTTTTLFKFIFKKRKREKKSEKKKPTEIHNGDIGTRLFQGVKDQTIMSNVVAS